MSNSLLQSINTSLTNIEKKNKINKDTQELLTNTLSERKIQSTDQKLNIILTSLYGQSLINDSITESISTILTTLSYIVVEGNKHKEE